MYHMVHKYKETNSGPFHSRKMRVLMRSLHSHSKINTTHQTGQKIQILELLKKLSLKQVLYVWFLKMINIGLHIIMTSLGVRQMKLIKVHSNTTKLVYSLIISSQSQTRCKKHRRFCAREHF